jgi:hypothetical protein
MENTNINPLLCNPETGVCEIPGTEINNNYQLNLIKISLLSLFILPIQFVLPVGESSHS